MRLPTALALAVLAAVPVAAGPAVAADATLASVTLLDGWRQADGSRVAAVEITIPPESHTYWRVPGAVGFAPIFDWSGSDNLQSVRYEWPRPAILESFGFTSFGYVRSLVLPVLLTPADPAAPMEIALALTFGICNDICMREEREVAARLAPDTATDGRERIEAALAERAKTADEGNVAGVACTVVPEGDGFAVTAAVTFDAAPPRRQYGVLESTQPGLLAGDFDSRTDGRVVTVRAPVSGPVLDRGALRITVLDDSRAVEVRGCGATG
jgi:DsbC/DsbD-like thiol-disulfide interchange protein